MASFNGGKFIEEQVLSILNQTVPPSEIVIVDDGSTDNTVDLLHSLAQKHPCIRVYENPHNLGITRTFEKAITSTRGEYVALSDQDDVWLPEKIETLLGELGDYDAVYSNSLLVDTDGNPLGKLFSSMMNLKTYTNGVPFLLANTVPGHTMLIRKEFLKKIIPFPSNLYFDLWIAFNAASSRGIKYVDQVLVHYRQHNTNAVGTKLSGTKAIKTPASEEFLRKRRELETLATSPVVDGYTAQTLNQLLKYFHRWPSFARSAFFFQHYQQILSAKKKPGYRKLLYCIKMFFKPNF